jgi:hypothetical protein
MAERVRAANAANTANGGGCAGLTTATAGSGARMGGAAATPRSLQ